jgi:T5SS/PEP-CTERM-associated repeat protein
MPYSPSRCDCQPAWLYLLSFCLVALLGYPLRANEYFLDSDQVWSQPTWNGSVGQEPPFGPPGPDDEAIIDSFTVTAAAGTTVGQLESEAGTLVMQGTFNCDTYLPNSAAQAMGPGTMTVQTIDADSLDFPAAGVNLVGGGSYNVTNLTGSVDFDGPSLSIQNYAGSAAGGIGVVIDSGIATIQTGGVTNGPVVVSGGGQLTIPFIMDTVTPNGSGINVLPGGTLTVPGALTSDGASGGLFYIGGMATVNSTMTLDGSGGVGGSGSLDMGATLTVGGQLVVGDADPGGFVLSTSASSVITCAGSLVLGDESGSAGTVDLDGAGSLLEINGDSNVTIGANGMGDLEVNSGGQMIFGSGPVHLFAVGLDAGSNGVVNVFGPGASVDAHTANLRLADTAGSYGKVTVSGGASMIFGGGNVTNIGYAGTGELDVENGSTLTLMSAVADPKLIIGQQNGSMGTLVIDSGLMVDLRGAQVNIAAAPGSTGTVDVYDDSKLLLAGKSFFVGDGGRGELDIGFGGKVTLGSNKATAPDLHFGVANAAGSTGKVSVSGAGSNLTLDRNLIPIIGVNGDGTMMVDSGGDVLLNALELADSPSSKGTLLFAGKGTTGTVEDQLFVGGQPTNKGGKATLTVKQSAELHSCLFAGSELYISAQSKVVLDQTGRIVVGQGAAGPPGSLRVHAPSKLIGPGKVIGKVILPAGGKFAPGGGEGTFTIDGDFDQTDNGGGEMDFQVGGTKAGAEHDQLVVNGEAKLGGTLKLQFVNGYQPQIGDTLAVIKASKLSGNFTKVTSTGVKLAASATAQGLAFKVMDVEPGLPVQTSVTRASAARGQAFSFRIAATNQPTTYTATGLPAGLTIDRATGAISGMPKEAGRFPVVLGFASNTGIGEGMLDLGIDGLPTR